jgi:aspartate 1-decarboxylase
MQIEVLKSKIHRATVTEMDLNYSGSIGIDRTLMKLAGIAENEKVLIANLRNGRRIETYALSEPADSGKICIYGPAGRLCRVGDLLVIMAFGIVEMSEKITPKILIMDKHNRVKHAK